MKGLITTTMKLKKEKDLTLAINFRTADDSVGHIQLTEHSWGSDWAIFFNSACVHTSKTLKPAISKLRRLGLTEGNFEIDESELF